MRTVSRLLKAASAALLGWTAHARAADELPPPRPLPQFRDDSPRVLGQEFERLLNELKVERDALDAEWKVYARQRTPVRAPSAEDPRDLEDMLKRALERLRQRELQPTLGVPIPKLDVPPKKAELIEAKPDEGAQKPKTVAVGENTVADVSSPGGVDPLSLGNSLFRLEKYADALASFRAVDLKTKALEERAPIQFLMASCLLHLGKNDEAIELLREAANARNNERTAGYAQWLLEMQRWQREIANSLEDIRRRRLTAERQP
jgi:tetratricopeptide (TPR) repeat protein